MKISNFILMWVEPVKKSLYTQTLFRKRIVLSPTYFDEDVRKYFGDKNISVLTLVLLKPDLSFLERL